MAKFTFFCEAKEEGSNRYKEVIYVYDNLTNDLTDVFGQLVTSKNKEVATCSKLPTTSRTKNLSSNNKLRIQIGTDCNQNCGYCSQKAFIGNHNLLQPEDIKNFVDMIPPSVNPQRAIEFWGGEPLLYWDTILPLATKLRKKFPQNAFFLVTNGTLLTPAINKSLDVLGFRVGISHDGPGQKNRGYNLFENDKKREVVIDLFNRLSATDRISFNTMITKNNYDRGKINKWFEEHLGTTSFKIGEGGIIYPTTLRGLDYCLSSDEEHFLYRRTLLRDIRYNTCPNFNHHYIQSERQYRMMTGSGKTYLGWRCGADREDIISCDLKGNLLVCQSVSVDDVLYNGKSATYGHMSTSSDSILNNISVIEDMTNCMDCPSLSLCGGVCPLIDGELWDRGCDNFFSDTIPYLAATIEYLVGAIPFYVEGPLIDSRSDLFGVTANPSVLFFDSPERIWTEN